MKIPLKGYQKGSVRSAGSAATTTIIFAAVIIISIAGFYLYANKGKNQSSEADYLNSITVTGSSANPNGGQILNNTNDVHATTNTGGAGSVTGLTDAQFIAVTGDKQGKVMARGDINLDGYEDAIVQEVFCGASCSVDLAVVFNEQNKSARKLSPSGYTEAFSPAYMSSSAAKSQVTNIIIKNGVVTLTGYGLDCHKYQEMREEASCTEEKWRILKTVTYKFDGKEMIQLEVKSADAKSSLEIENTITADKLRNMSYPASKGIMETGGKYFTTFKNGLYQSEKISCAGVSTCPHGEYSFSEVHMMAINSKKDVAAVVILSSYAPSLTEFRQRVAKNGAQAIDVYFVTGKGRSIAAVAPYNLGWGFQADTHVRALKITNVKIDDIDDSIKVYGSALTTDQQGNTKNIDLIYDFILREGVVTLI